MSDQIQDHVPIVPEPPPFVPTPPEPSRLVQWLQSAWDYLAARPGLTFFVILPNLIFFIYLSCIASPQYVSEAHFMVRSEKSQSGTPLALMMEMGGGAITSENTYAVQDYMVSRDAMELLLKQDGLAKVFDSHGADFIARYPNWFSRQDMESFFKYYKKHVKAQIDGETSLSVLTVRTFSPADSQRIAQALVAAAENLVNEINVRQRQNLIGAAQMEVSQTMEKLKELQARLANFRDANAIIDPGKQSVSLLGTEYTLQSMLTSTQMRLAQTLKTAPDSPAIPIYQNQIAVLQQELKTASARLTGATHSLVPKLSEYDLLTVERQLLEKVLLSEVTSLESAKAQADRQMVFLEEVSKPNKPDYPEYPPLIVFMFISLACTYGVYASARLLIAGAREHKIS